MERPVNDVLLGWLPTEAAGAHFDEAHSYIDAIELSSTVRGPRSARRTFTVGLSHESQR